MNKQQLASKIWAAANKMRSKINAGEYKDYILGFMFYKFLSEKEEKFLLEQGFTSDDIKADVNENNQEVLDFVRNSLGYFISYKDLFSTWLNLGAEFNVSNVRDALNAFDRLVEERNVTTGNIPANRKIFSKIFSTLESGLGKLGDTSGAQTKAVKGLLLLIDEIPAVNDKQDYDVLGFVYEYLIGMFAANAGKKAGEFYTPHEVAVFMAELVAEHLKDRKQIEIYDPTSGSGSLLINIGNAVAKYMDDRNHISYLAQELIESTYNLTRMNLVMRGIKPDNIKIRNGDTLAEDWPFFDEENKDLGYHFMAVDAVVSNPPYSQHWDPEYKDVDPRFKDYGVAPKQKADFAFLLHDLYHVNEDGIMCIVLPHGVLFRGNKDDNSEGKIRKNLIERNKIAAIIGLPPNIFFGTGIPTIIMVLKHKRENTDVLFVDGSHGFVKEGKQNKLRARDVRKLVDTVVNCRTIPGFSRLVSKEEIQKNEYNLNIPRYIDSAEQQENWDINALMFGGMPPKEIDAFSEFWNVFPTLKNDLLEANTQGYFELKSDKVTECIQNNNDVKKFLSDFSNRFSDMENYFYQELIAGCDSDLKKFNIVKEKEVLTDNIFRRMENILLLDKYNVYQLFDDLWFEISGDLEIIQKEGFEALHKVDPNMVMKKSGDESVEVQDGWKGRIIPFALLWSSILKEEYENVKTKEMEAESSNGEWQSILDEMTEEEKDFDIWKEDEEKLDSKSFGKFIKELRKQAKDKGTTALDAPEQKWLKVADLMDKEKRENKQAKEMMSALVEHTISVVNNLTVEQGKELLKLKWITPLVNDVMAYPFHVLKDFGKDIIALAKKYQVTFSSLENDINSTSNDLSGMLDDLVGDKDDMRGLNELKKLLGDK